MNIDRFTLDNLDFWTPDRNVKKRVENPWLIKVISFSEEFFDCFSSNICEQKFNCHGNRITVVRRKRENERAGWFITTLKVLSFLVGFGFVVLGIKFAYRHTFKIQSPIEDKLFDCEQESLREEITKFALARARQKAAEAEAIAEREYRAEQACRAAQAQLNMEEMKAQLEVEIEQARLEIEKQKEQLEMDRHKARLESEALEQQMKSLLQEINPPQVEIINHAYSQTISELKQKIKSLYEIIDALKSEVERLNEILASDFKPDEIIRIINEKILRLHQEIERLNNSIKSDFRSDETIHFLHEEIQKLNQEIDILGKRAAATLKPHERMLLQENQRLKQKVEKLKIIRKAANEKIAVMTQAMEMAKQGYLMSLESVVKIQEGNSAIIRDAMLTQTIERTKMTTQNYHKCLEDIAKTKEIIASRAREQMRASEIIAPLTRIVSPTQTDAPRSSSPTSDVTSSSYVQQENSTDPLSSIKQVINPISATE